MARNIIGLDFETFGTRDLKECGVYQYVNDHLFLPLIASVVSQTGDVQRISLYEKRPQMIALLQQRVHEAELIAAQNAEFEWLVCQWLGIILPPERFVDTAVIARLEGADSALANAAPQLLGVDKIEEGVDLIKLFCVPNLHNTNGFNTDLPSTYPEHWARFMVYCDNDAKLAKDLLLKFGISNAEINFTGITMRMNSVGWPVDMDSVMQMQQTFERNNEELLRRFRDTHNLPDFNFNSHKQLKEFCLDRGVRATSFDELHVQKLINSIEEKLRSASSSRQDHYYEVLDMLSTKQLLGGSSLRKLPRIIAQTGEDNRLRGQYMHAGAGQSGRTSGRGVQMQNLTRLNSSLTISLDEDFSQADNRLLSANMRQLFAAPEGQLLAVGDLASIESRGLAWMANEAWKIEAYQQGLDVYAKQAAMFYHKPYESITKPERTFGKVGELSCGYGAGPGAVKDFAEKMGVPLTDLESGELVMDWRASNPAIVGFWAELESAFRNCLTSAREQMLTLGPGTSKLLFRSEPAPGSLRTQTGDSKLLSVRMRVSLVLVSGNVHTFERVFHGVTTPGREIRYFKPRSGKTGPLWLSTWMNPKTKRRQYHTLYGGKLAGIVTQSLCRELFMIMLHNLQKTDVVGDLMIGQFHDEVVFQIYDYLADSFGESLKRRMSQTILPGLPMAAEVGVARRYIK